MARTNPTAHPVRLMLEVVSAPAAFELLLGVLKKPSSQKDLRSRRGIAQSAASRALREMSLIGVLEFDGTTYSVRDPDACREMLRAAGRVTEAGNRADRKALDAFFDEIDE